MSAFIEHAVVIGIALTSAGLVVRSRLRALEGKGCDGCAAGQDGPGPDRPIPPSALLRKARR